MHAAQGSASVLPWPGQSLQLSLNCFGLGTLYSLDSLAGPALGRYDVQTRETFPYDIEVKSIDPYQSRFAWLAEVLSLRVRSLLNFKVPHPSLVFSC